MSRQSVDARSARAPAYGGPKILAIESSCDESAAAVLDGTRSLLSSVISSQVELHSPYGGVVPELASRNHLLALPGVVEQALRDADTSLDELAGIAVTTGPGLLGSLLVGLEYAKGMAMAMDLPLLGVHHLEGHLRAPWLGSPDEEPPGLPALGLIVSGGHTSLVHVTEAGGYHIMGQTLDDAAGEAFDKLSKMLGLGYPGGPIVDRLAEKGDPKRWRLPRALPKRDNFDFSFSGLKTSALYTLRDLGAAPTEREIWDLCASFRAAVVDVLVKKTLRAARKLGVKQLILTGGVAANRELRRRMAVAAGSDGLKLAVAPPVLCTDNAAMIGAAGYARLWPKMTASSGFSSCELDARAAWSLEELSAEAAS